MLTYPKCDSDGDSYHKTLSTKKCFEKMKTHVTDITEILKSTGSSWKMKLKYSFSILLIQ